MNLSWLFLINFLLFTIRMLKCDSFKKGFDLLGHFLPALGLVLLCLVGCNENLAAATFVLIAGSQGLCSGGWFASFLDLAPRLNAIFHANIVQTSFFIEMCRKLRDFQVLRCFIRLFHITVCCGQCSMSLFPGRMDLWGSIRRLEPVFPHRRRSECFKWCILCDFCQGTCSAVGCSEETAGSCHQQWNCDQILGNWAYVYNILSCSV